LKHPAFSAAHADRAASPPAHPLCGSYGGSDNEKASSASHLHLIEAMQGTRAHGIRHVARHLHRLQQSAEALEFRLNRTQAQAQLNAECAALPSDAPHRIRLTLQRDGRIAVATSALAPLARADDGTVTLLFADRYGFTPTSAEDRLLHHKTSRRDGYDRAWQRAERLHAFDMLFFNDRGELTEGGRSNVFVKCDGRWWTPPLSSGVLPGIMRSVLLEDTALNASERVLRREDLPHAQAWLVCNAVRGALAATVRI